MLFCFPCSAIDPYRLFWCELLSLGDISCGVVCHLSSVMEQEGTTDHTVETQQQYLSPETSGRDIAVEFFFEYFFCI